MSVARIKDPMVERKPSVDENRKAHGAPNGKKSAQI